VILRSTTGNCLDIDPTPLVNAFDCGWGTCPSRRVRKNGN
jgi:hypothetical protein